MDILSINSHVVFGHVGAQATVLAWQRLGLDAGHLPTVLFSNHPGHGGRRGAALPAALLREAVEGLAERGFLAGVRALHSGYLGEGAQAEIVLAALAAMREQAPPAVYCCDPVLGDAGGLYVPDVVADAVRSRLLPAADIVTPNLFELAVLAGRPVGGPDDAVDAARALLALGPRLVVCTSAERALDGIASLAVTAEGVWRVRTPAVAAAPQGVGDLFCALLLGRYLVDGDVGAALAGAAAATYGVIAASLGRPDRELAIVGAQQEIVAPALSVSAERL